VKKEIDKLSQEILDLEQKNSNLVSLIDSFQDPDTVELEAKRRLNLKKPGEEVAVILTDKKDEPQNIVNQHQDGIDSSVEKSNDRDASSSNVVKWWGYITRD
jgi:hypothetical protein